ncbi:uncharacterized protein ASPGLDRAFT_67545 [Aspergillus glaucus CBS 516.65]|uniref:NB-ARC domain-containing protein n=1 Tax=Aspergillus glaucus CBS 516.65 TaxID=1160497 RepID=A0A1L9VFF9_ASPGL|nr:hypothetical protein ASPGLDRAFT_67545 [Aspergillus glaucus CBS 516.65]OJJ82646.1 hypothetical protein ASPGLDRAFT_67545 [Aspergillus glaucus CBS 516.65]
MQLLSSFQSIRFGLMVGVKGVVLSRNTDIRLGDIVVSKPMDTHGGVVQYDYGKALDGGYFQQTRMLNLDHLTEDSQVIGFLAEIEQKMSKQAVNLARSTQEDCLYQSDYSHVDPDYQTCHDCNTERTVPRHSRNDDDPFVHYGLIASANLVAKDSRVRDQLSRELGACCVEMEAAGLINNYPCLVVRGICDYADSTRTKNGRDTLLPLPQHMRRNSSLQLQFHVPFDLTAMPVIKYFLGRQDKLVHLWEYLQPESSESRNVAVLHGLGGMRKTQLAVRFARDHRNDFIAIFWLGAKDRDTVLQSLSSVLSQLPQPNTEMVDEEKVEKRARHVLRWLALEGNSRWLVIFDNVDQYVDGHDDNAQNCFDISEFFPTADHGSILVTSRLQALTELGMSFPVPKLETLEAIQLLLQSSSLPLNDNIEKNPDTLALSGRLDRLPLTIIIAGSFIRETGTSISEYLQYYTESWDELQSQSRPGRHYPQGNILQTWTISFNEMKKRNPNAAELLLLLSYFDNRSIWYGLVRCCCNSCSSDALAWFQKTVSNELAFKSTLRPLIKFSLVEPERQEGSYTIHPVVQNWCLHVARERGDEEKFPKALQRLLPHADHIVCGDWSSNNNTAVFGTLNNIGLLYSKQHKLKKAKELFCQALPGAKEILGPDHMVTLTTISNIGDEMCHQVLAVKKKLLRPNDPSTLGTANQIATLYSDQGKLKEAEEMYCQILSIAEKALGADYPLTLDIIHNLAVTYAEQKMVKEAKKRYCQALAGLFTIGTFYIKQGRLSELEEMYCQVLVKMEKSLGRDHPTPLKVVDVLDGVREFNTLEDEEDKRHQKWVLLKKLDK